MSTYLIWFTGLSGSGKTTLSSMLNKLLLGEKRKTQVLDGDSLRQGLCNDLGFNQEDRRENIRRAAEVAKLFIEADILTIAAFMSPYAADRKMVRQLIGSNRYIEVYCRCELSVCETRDTKGLYRRARQGEITHLTGIHEPYEDADTADLVIDTDCLSETQALDRIKCFLATETKLIN